MAASIIDHPPRIVSAFVAVPIVDFEGSFASISMEKLEGLIWRCSPTVYWLWACGLEEKLDSK
jgi:hypothetical protein